MYNIKSLFNQWLNCVPLMSTEPSCLKCTASSHSKMSRAVHVRFYFNPQKSIGKCQLNELFSKYYYILDNFTSNCLSWIELSFLQQVSFLFHLHLKLKTASSIYLFFLQQYNSCICHFSMKSNLSKTMSFVRYLKRWFIVKAEVINKSQCNKKFNSLEVYLSLASFFLLCYRCNENKMLYMVFKNNYCTPKASRGLNRHAWSIEIW